MTRDPEEGPTPRTSARTGPDAPAALAPLVTWVLFVLAVLIVGGLYAADARSTDPPWINHDVAYHAYLGLSMLHGSRLYLDLKEDNPPGNVLLWAGVLWLSERLRLPDFFGLHAFVLLLGLAGLAVLRSALPEREGLAFLVVGLAYLVVLVRGNFSNNLFPAAPGMPYDFGQREHLFSLLFVPYLLLRISGRRVSRPVYGWLLLLGFVATFKPFWPPMVAIVELFCAVRRGGRSVLVPATLSAGMGGPFLLLLLHSPDSFLTFFGENIPMYLRGGYTHYDTSLAFFLATPLHYQMVAGWLLLIGGVALCAWRRAVDRPALLLLLLVAAMAYGSVLHQHKFWSYHTMAFFALSVVPGAFLLARAASTLRRGVSHGWAAAAAAAVALGFVGSTIAGTSQMLRNCPPLDEALVPLIEPYEKTMYFSMSVTTSYAPLLLRKPMVGPWTVFLDLPELLFLPDAGQRQAALADYAERVNRVIEQERPDLLVYSPIGQALPAGLSLHDILLGLGVDPARHGYVQVPPTQLLAIDGRLGDFIVYRRDVRAGFTLR